MNLPQATKKLEEYSTEYLEQQKKSYYIEMDVELVEALNVAIKLMKEKMEEGETK